MFGKNGANLPNIGKSIPVRFLYFATKRANPRAQEAKDVRGFRALTREGGARNERRSRPARSAKPRQKSREFAKHWQNAAQRGLKRLWYVFTQKLPR
jgi:hypothetical protein